VRLVNVQKFAVRRHCKAMKELSDLLGLAASGQR
jgi:hypothetical protein